MKLYLWGLCLAMAGSCVAARAQVIYPPAPAQGSSGSRVLVCRDTTDQVNTGSTTQNAVWTCPVPAGTLSANSQLVFSSTLMNGNSNTAGCIFQLRVATSAAGANPTFLGSVTSSLAGRTYMYNTTLSNRGATNAQEIQTMTMFSNTYPQVTYITTGFDTTQPLYLSMMATNSAAADSCVLNAATVEVLP